MTDVAELVQRNARFATSGHVAGLLINPSGNVMVVGCVDPRVAPTQVLGLAHGEAAVIRNVGGRITPATLRSMAMLTKVGQAHAEDRSPGDWNLVVLHHTDCGMNDLAAFPELLVDYFEGPVEERAVTDPYASVRIDVDVLLEALHAPAFLVSGLVYDVATGLVEVVVPPTPLTLPGQ